MTITPSQEGLTAEDREWMLEIRERQSNPNLYNEDVEWLITTLETVSDALAASRRECADAVKALDETEQAWLGEVKGLEQERQAALDRLKLLDEGPCVLLSVDDYERVMDEKRDALDTVAVLREFAAHLWTCHSIQRGSDPPGPCDCGYADLDHDLPPFVQQERERREWEQEVVESARHIGRIGYAHNPNIAALRTILDREPKPENA